MDDQAMLETLSNLIGQAEKRKKALKRKGARGHQAWLHAGDLVRALEEARECVRDIRNEGA